MKFHTLAATAAALLLLAPASANAWQACYWNGKQMPCEVRHSGDWRFWTVFFEDGTRHKVNGPEGIVETLSPDGRMTRRRVYGAAGQTWEGVVGVWVMRARFQNGDNLAVVL